ncbi:MAG: hypothetical protein V7724_04420 [Sediminicola sp.]
MGKAKGIGKKHWFWNLIIVLTIVVVLVAFMAHYKNWTRINPDSIEILSGIYHTELHYSEIDSVLMVPKIPSLERVNGFSAFQKEKGVFRDSLSDTEVYIYVDRLSQSKIKLVYQDSLKVFLNFADSTETALMYQFLSNKINPLEGETGQK